MPNLLLHLLLLLLLLLLGLVFVTDARQFSNPVLNITNSGFGSVISKDGIYYTVLKSDPKSFNVYHSLDLQNWSLFGELFKDPPVWAKLSITSGTIFASNSGDYRFYYRGYNNTVGQFAIGVAFAKSPEGPYYTTEHQLAWEENDGYENPVVLDDSGRYYLYYRSEKTNTITARMLSPDGLGLLDDAQHIVLQIYDSPTNSYVIKHDNLYYMLYSSCTQLGSARSLSPLGPFSVGPPLQLRNVTRVGSVGIVKDGDDDVILYKDCDKGAIHANTLQWGDDGWPFVEL